MRPLLCLILICCFGCGPRAVKVHSLPAPPPETPPVNLHPSLHQRNELGPKGQGSCVHASMTMMLRWQNRCDFAARWWRSYRDGETAGGLMQKLELNDEDFIWTEKADPRFLDAASISRRGAVLWWKTSHCCFFSGWVKGKDGKTYASIIDNNRPGVWEYTEREQFIRGWAGFGGFALTTLSPPATSMPWLSYEIDD